MEALKMLSERRAAVFAAGIVIGLVVGILYAWVLAPVEFVDADITHLRRDLKVDYLRSVIDSYGQSLDNEIAVTRYEALMKNA